MPRPPIGNRSAALPVAKPILPRPALPEDGGRGSGYPLGAWQRDGSFKFHSPEAEQQWHADSFMQGSHHLHWMKGRPLSADETKLAEMGLPHSDDVYQGPDGQHYQSTQASREDPHLRAIRAAHLAEEPAVGLATEMARRASLKALPRALAAMAAANDNRRAANENLPSLAGPSSGKAESAESTASSVKTYPGIGRFAAMAKATNEAGGHVFRTAEITQGVADAIRPTASEVTLDNADKVAAAGNALGSLFTDESYGDAYRRNLADEQKKTTEARERLGLLGAGVEAAPTFIPGYGDVLGIATDLKMYREHPEERTWKNYGLTALGAVPFIPSVANTIKKVDHAIEAAEDGAKAIANDGETAGRLVNEARSSVPDWDAEIFEAQRYPHTESEIRKMNGETRGVVFVDERPPDNEAARKFQEEASGAYFSVDTERQLVPALAYKNPNERGVHVVKFDSYEISDDGSTLFLKDQKTKLVFNDGSIRDLRDRFNRIRSALKQNPGVKILYEFPDEKTMEVAGKFIRNSGFSDIISVRVRK